VQYVLLAIVCCGSTLSVPARAASDVAADEALRREVAALAERVDRLETENAALKQRNESLERRVAELEPRIIGEPGPGVVAAPVVSAPPAPATVPPPAPALTSAAEPAQDKLKVSGLLFGDAYAVLASHDDSIEDQTGFWIRRGYLTFDAQLADDWSARLRFEANSPGDFTTNGKVEPFVKDAYLSWKHGGQQWLLGLSPAPTFDFVESFWGYRALEKTPLDLYRMGSSRDMGIAWKGSMSAGKVFYHAMFGNGSGDGSETNEGKKIMGGLGFRPTETLVLQLYADHEDRPGATDRDTLQVIAGWQGERSRYGLQYATQRREVESASATDVAVASAFAAWHLTRQGSLIARFDRSFDGYPDADRIPYLRIANDARFDLALLAWEQVLQRQIQLIPNLEYVRYRDSSGMPQLDDDLYGRLTLYFQF
jgi:hypothetical protein